MLREVVERYGIDRHVVPVAALAAGGAAEGAGAAGGAAAASAAPAAPAGASRGLGGHAEDLAGGASDMIGKAKDPIGSGIRSGANAVNAGISGLRSIPESADRFYEDLAALDRLATKREIIIGRDPDPAEPEDIAETAARIKAERGGRQTGWEKPAAKAIEEISTTFNDPNGAFGGPHDKRRVLKRIREGAKIMQRGGESPFATDRETFFAELDAIDRIEV